MNKDAFELRIEDWEKFGEGHAAESFFHKSDKELMMKLYREGIDKEVPFKELIKTESIASMGIPAARPISYIKYGNRYGAVFERIHGKRSFARIIEEEPERLEEISRLFAIHTGKLHSVPCDKSCFDSYQDIYKKEIENSIYITDYQKKKAMELLLSVPEADTCLHGDLHQGNIIMDKDGRVYFIDFPDFTYGNPLLDFGMTSKIMYFSDDKDIEDQLHMSREMFIKSWDAFYREYFGKDDIREMKAYLKQFAGLRGIVLTNFWKGREDMRRIVDTIFGK